jgi:hypothetical protein
MEDGMRIRLLLAAAIVSLLPVSSVAQTPCSIPFAVIFQDGSNNVLHGFSSLDEQWFAELQKKYPSVCHVEPPHMFYESSNGGPPRLTGDLIYPNVAPEVAPLVLYIKAIPRVFKGTRTQTNTSQSEAPVNGTATDESGNIYHVEGTANITTTTSQGVPYLVDYDDLIVLIQKKKLIGIWDTMQSFHRKTLCPAMFGVCIANRNAYHKLLEDSIKWMIKAGAH